MDVFELRNRLVADYASYTRSFIKIADPRVSQKVETALDRGDLWPEPLLQLNPTFRPGGPIDALVDEGLLHPECRRIFRVEKTENDHTGQPLLLHTHQVEAIRLAHQDRSYVLTSGTGSGKSLTYIVPIVDHVLRRGTGQGVQAIVVYPMNALANSQCEELSKFLERGYPPGQSPVRFARYTGQERGADRDQIRDNPPDILLTNYMMLELLLTRHEDQKLVRHARGLKFLVFDELHTYRGRQGADVALLIRRCRIALEARNLICVGTSATMASEGNSLDQKRAVADVAERLFGTPIDESQVVGETLERATPEINPSAPEVLPHLRSAVLGQSPPPESYEQFRQHPLASWLETTFGVRTEEETGRLVRQAPSRLMGPDGAAVRLAQLTSAPDAASCLEVIRQFLLKGAELRRSPSSRFPIFAFRLHQFFTRADTVWATLESEADRHLELAKLGGKPEEPEKTLYPLVFCRNCGQEYYRVFITGDGGTRRLVPRDDRRPDGDDRNGDAYLYLSTANPWPTADDALRARLPEFFTETTKTKGERIRPEFRGNVPELIHVDPLGRFTAEGQGLNAALIRENFLFCLNPKCGVAYPKNQKSERNKLATLGVDNRSTATTILAVQALIDLRNDPTLRPEARKLLSFTDNRQDASLQAGHFNDFAQVALLRSALHKATATSGPGGLSHQDLSRRVLESLSLDFEDYAADPEIRGVNRTQTTEALRRVIDYHLYRDLLRGWRVTAPNLEDCGLLKFDYDGVSGPDSLLAEDELWQRGFETGVGTRESQFHPVPPALQAAPPEIRERIVRTLLDYLRREMAIKVDVLDPRKQHDLVEQTRPRLQEGTVWYLDDPRDLTKSRIAYPSTRPPHRADPEGLYISGQSNFGAFLRRELRTYLPGNRALSFDEATLAIDFLLRALKRYGIVEAVRSNPSGYQLNHATQRWLAGEGVVSPADHTRLLEVGDIPPDVNRYFVDCYRRFVDLKCLLEAREHTAQVDPADREERETRFREGDLPLLFCSPTMELGVDIAQLNVVNLRNVPPTPANYAQRSGRAGRGGQPALVYTYCAGRSPHDQYYFKEPARMVGGSVAPPRIDLANRDLVRAHLHAIWLEVTMFDLGKTLTSVIDVQHDEGRVSLPLKPRLSQALANPAHRAAALARANLLLDDLRDSLRAAGWFHDNWAREVYDQVERSLDRACDRWRELYRAATRQRELHHRILVDPSRPDSERNQSRRLRAQAEAQIRLLTEAQGIYEGDFYVYRYFAAEGFLPGYNFPRLPISAFVPARRTRNRDEFLSRPRFLAISEFGPRALIYHEGARYRVTKVNLDFGTDSIEDTHVIVTSTLKRCARCGYAHLERGVNLDEVCDRCGAPLDGPTVIENLVRMQNVTLDPAKRITCDEEERQRFGYRLVTAYRFPEVDGKFDRRDAEVVLDGHSLMQLSYGDATDLFRINQGWLNQDPAEGSGFLLDLERGFWAANRNDTSDEEDPTAGRRMRVVPYVQDTKNALVLRFSTSFPDAEMAGLQSAFKEAIQKLFQIEPRELASEALPSPRDRREILFYESSEGGAGVLRQLVDNPDVVPRLARLALEICHFDPVTLEDRKPHLCGKACYECLLDYFNQPDHLLLDRYLIRNHLAELARATCRPAGGAGSRGERLAALRQRCDSALETRWLDLLERLLLRLPSDAQHPLPQYHTKPDFFYRDDNTAIYIDGPVHDDPSQRREDEAINRRLMEAGFVVLRFHHAADWNALLLSHPDIFGTPQS